MLRRLLTSGGITNTSIHNALVSLLGQPIAESSALCIPIAAYTMAETYMCQAADGAGVTALN